MRLLGNRNEAGRGWVPVGVVSLGAGGELVDELEGAGHRVWRLDLRGLPDVVRGMRTLRRIIEAEGVDALVAWPYTLCCCR